MDSATRNQIQQTTQAARRLLEEDYLRQLEGKYDIHLDGTIAPKPGKHLDEKDKLVREKIISAIQHNAADGGSQKEGVNTYLREASFTTLNRIIALKMMEARRLVLECVSMGEESSGYKEFLLLAPGLSVLSEQAYRMYIESVFDEIGLGVRVLFDRRDPISLLWPRRPVLVELLGFLNATELKGVWTEDETIGWVFQYFNSMDERRQMRESQVPHNSRELAVRNQFFTPQYVVRLLTDNTLGRIWYDMCQGETALKTDCRYLMRRPNEVFLKEGEVGPSPPGGDDGAPQVEALMQPVYIKHRPKMDPRDIRILDPACGSGHFLLYAFELLERIYEEALGCLENPKSKITGRTLREDYLTLEDLRRALPKLIIEENLHGIDIDPRAVQIAVLALWMRGQKSWENAGVKANERPRIERSNIVISEPMPGESDFRHEFTSAISPHVLGQLVNVVFDKMRLADEAGFLLKIEEKIREAIAEAKKQWLEAPRTEQKLLFPQLNTPKPTQQEFSFSVREITDDKFWVEAEGRILEALKKYSEMAENGKGAQRRLFAKDTARGFAFIDLCRKRYDVVLMNPPFGESTERTKANVAKEWPKEKGDLGCCFVSNGLRVTSNGGRLGVLMTRTPYYLSSFARWRAEVVLGLGGLDLFVDLGLGVLEAMVETCACVYEPRAGGH